MNDEDRRPCIRGCVWPPANEGDAPKPKEARHGESKHEQLCDSCYYRMKHALDSIPDLMANMRLSITPGGSVDYSERVSGSSDGSPAPLRIAPLDASDSLYAKLVSWTEVFGGEFKIPQPSVAVWINFREVQGSKPVTPIVAHQLAAQLTSWFLVRLEQIAASPQAAEFHDDLCYGWTDAQGVFALAGAYGVEPRPLRAADKRECPVCGRKEVFVAWPDTLNPDVRIMCDRCKWVAEPELYGHYAELFKSA